jgi:hypothetical protein
LPNCINTLAFYLLIVLLNKTTPCIYRSLGAASKASVVERPKVSSQRCVSKAKCSKAVGKQIEMCTLGIPWDCHSGPARWQRKQSSNTWKAEEIYRFAMIRNQNNGDTAVSGLAGEILPRQTTKARTFSHLMGRNK